MEGWIKLHRSLLNWQWSNDPNVFLVFIRLLLKANHAECYWKGEKVSRGQVIVGRDELAKEIGISPQQVRTALAKLKSTSEITSKSTNRYTLISIKNYDHYQQINQPDNKQITNNQPTNNHKQEYKNVKNDKNILPKGNGKAFGDGLVNFCMDNFKETWGYLPTDKKPRFEAFNLVRATKKLISQRKGKGQDTDERVTKLLTTYFRWIRSQDWGEKVQTMSTVRLKLPIFVSEVDNGRYIKDQTTNRRT